MSFSFGFGGDDIGGDDAEAVGNGLQDAAMREDAAAIKPKRWSLKELLAFVPSQICYNTLQISPEGADGDHSYRIPRRSLFDIRAQLMAEANQDENENDKLLKGLDTGDLTPGQYEGGFKTWECAVDLAREVSELQLHGKSHVIELGAGSALPSLMLLQAALRNDTGHQEVRLTICDYNEDVLKLCTMPNVLLNCILSTSNDSSVPLDNQDRELDLEATLPRGAEQLEQQLALRGISLDFVSGTWGEEFIDLLRPAAAYEAPDNILILASETIYSLETIEIFTSAVLELLRAARTSARALVAAKRIYFGVGGGIDDFSRCLRKAGGRIGTISENTGSGVGRVILEVIIAT